MRKFGIIFFTLLFLFPFCHINAQASSAGFVSSNNIWYSKDPFQEGDVIKIYTLVFNPDERELSGTVVFFDNDIVLDKTTFKVAPDGVQQIHISWTATAGDHKIFGRIQNAKFLISDGKYEDAYLLQNETMKSARTIAPKITPKTETSPESKNKTISNTNDANSGFIQDIGKAIAENTPEVIAKPVSSASNTVENFRKNTSLVLDSKKTELKKQIEEINKPNPPSVSDNSQVIEKQATEKKEASQKLLKPLKYVELFFFSLFSFIFKTKLLFYGILALLLFLFLRFFWRKIFRRR